MRSYTDYFIFLLRETILFRAEIIVKEQCFLKRKTNGPNIQSAIMKRLDLIEYSCIIFFLSKKFYLKNKDHKKYQIYQFKISY